MYTQSSCATLTAQGIAIREAACHFGDGKTLPFSPCKRGYIPVVDGGRKFACHLHHKMREKRFNEEGGKFRLGEKPLTDFWDNEASNVDDETAQSCVTDTKEVQSVCSSKIKTEDMNI